MMIMCRKIGNDRTSFKNSFTAIQDIQNFILFLQLSSTFVILIKILKIFFKKLELEKLFNPWLKPSFLFTCKVINGRNLAGELAEMHRVLLGAGHKGDRGEAVG